MSVQAGFSSVILRPLIPLVAIAQSLWCIRPIVTFPAKQHCHWPLAGTHVPSCSGSETELVWVTGCIPRQYTLSWSPISHLLCGWSRGSVVRTSVLAGELTLSCARPAADGWPLMWASHPLQVSQLSLHPFRVNKWVVSCNWMSVTSVKDGNVWWMLWRKGRHGVFAGKTVWSMSERFEIIRSIKALCKYSFLFSFLYVDST